MVDFRPPIDVQAFQEPRRSADLPFTHGVQRNVDLALELVSGVVGGASMTDKENGTNMIGLVTILSVPARKREKGEGCLVPSMTFGNRAARPEYQRISALCDSHVTRW